jgi:sec-independent protein translocase protein TatB
MVIVGLLFLVIFGPSKLPQMARDLGGFVNEARRSVEGFKEELMIEEDNGQEPRKGRKPEESQGGLEREEVSAVERSDRRTE